MEPLLKIRSIFILALHPNQHYITKLNNPRIDKLLEEGRQTNDQIERKKIYQDFQTYLLEEVPAIFLYYPTTYTVTRIK